MAVENPPVDPKATGDKPVADTLTKQELAAQYGYAVKVIYANQELRTIFEQALNAKDGQWTGARFDRALKSSNWWKNNAESARQAWTLQKTGGADWDQTLESAKTLVTQRATQVGAVIDPKDVDTLALRYLYEDWKNPARDQLFNTAISSYLTMNRGQAVNRTNAFKNLADNYGVEYRDEWYARASTSILRGETTEDYWQNRIREDAKSKYKPIQGQIDAGQTTRMALSQYVQSMGNLLEIDPNSIKLDDPLLKRAWGQVDPKTGEASIKSLFDFETDVRNDARWAKTKNGQEAELSLAQSFMKSLGFGG